MDLFPLFISNFNECHADLGFKSGFISEAGPVKILFTLSQKVLKVCSLNSIIASRGSLHFQHIFHQEAINKTVRNVDRVDSKVYIYVVWKCWMTFACLDLQNYIRVSRTNSCGTNHDCLTLKNFSFSFPPLSRPLNNLTVSRIKERFTKLSVV